MLTELHVENLGIIDDVTVALGPGLTTVTGETGAGKTLLVVALGLIAGSRADASMVRSGAPEARVEARFVMDGAIDGAIEDAIDGETAVDLRGSAGAPGETELVLTRVVAAEGRSRAYMNGRLVTAGELAACTEDLLVHHGQHSHQALLHTASQRDALDAFAGAPAQEARREVATALAERRRADERIAEAGSGDRHALAREIDLLRFQVAEIADAAIDDPDEIDRIATEHELLTGARELRATLSGAYELLETTGGDAVGEAAAFLSDAKPFAALHQRALALQAELQTLAHDLRDAGESIVEDDARLSEIDERRRVLHDLTRKYGASLADVVAFGVAAADRLDTIENLDARAEALRAERDAATKRAEAAAQRLRRLRSEAADEMAGQVTNRLRQLALPSATFDITLTPTDLGDHGADEIAFLLAPNPGEPPRPIARAASGGELARTMLAVRVTLSFRGQGAPKVFVFDEIDAGIGGDAGAVVGRSLADLAVRRQVFAVTHLAQVAANADAQFAVTKRQRGERTVADVEELTGEIRVGELSRMLAGDDTSDHARSHAAELLAGAQRVSR